MNLRRNGIGARVAVAAVATAVVGVGILTGGVMLVGGDLFERLMIEHGESAAGAAAMFDDSVTRVVVLSLVIAVLAAIALAVMLGRRLAAPLQSIGRAARSVADGDYAFVLTVNPAGRILETNYADNRTSVLIRLFHDEFGLRQVEVT